MTHEDTMDLSTIAVLCISFCYIFFNVIICLCFTRTRSHRRDSSSNTSGDLEMIQMMKRSIDQQTHHDEACTTKMSVGNDQK